ncbi:MAG TPA: hypothetical protein VFL47_11545, partial [Flavisolibacter sp.]|nr:hypothetical protein [Flavisolibacter sp.]
MKKILLVVDGTNYSNSSFDFACRLNELEPILLTGIFVPQLDYANLWSYAATAQYGVLYGPTMDEEDAAVEKNVAHFEDQCRRNGIRYRVHRDLTDFAFPELKRESRFADVMVMSGELFFKEIITTNRDEYIGTAIHQA